MNHVPLVATPGDVTPEWLTGALVGSGAAPRGARVVGLSSETVGNGKIGENVRFVLDWSGPSDGAPSTVVGKFASPDPTSRQAGIMTGNYLKEVLFYRELATTVAIRAPRCHAAEIDTETGEFVLLLEDLAPCETGDQIRGCTVDQAALAIEELPRLHAPRWEDPALQHIEWLPPRSPEGAEMLQGLYQMLLPGFTERYGDRLPDETFEVTERFAPSVAAWSLGVEGPATLAHGDYRAENLMFGTPAGGYPVAVVDWGLLGVGPGVGDCAYLLGASLRVEDRRAREEELLRAYLAGLGACGVEGYGWDDMWRGYRYATFGGVLITVVASMVVGEDERGHQMFCAMAERHCSHVVDHDAFALLP